MENKIYSSYYLNDFFNKKMLIVIPHQDDEINVAGSSILNFLQMHGEVYVAYTTNGDYSLSAETRILEAIDALGELGVPKENVFLLGFGDNYNHSGYKHIFYSAELPHISPAKYTKTYGGGGIEDFSYVTTGQHSVYSSNAFFSDLTNLIIKLKPDLIIATDMDEHPDHRFLSYALDISMHRILSKDNNSYRPEIFKSLAYATAYTAVDDFFSYNLKSTSKPEVGITKQYERDIVNTSYYSWKNRIRFTTPQKSQLFCLNKNPLYCALRKHKSQYAHLHAGRIINSDKVFWNRRTDNIALFGKVKVSSGSAKYINDFQINSISNVDDFYIEWDDYCWIPSEADLKPVVTISWENNVVVQRIVIWGKIDSHLHGNVNALIGNTSVEAHLSPNGLPVVIDLPVTISTNKIRFQFSSFDWSSFGISEIEVFSKKNRHSIIKPFIQICVNGDFCYRYYVTNEKQVSLSIYKYLLDDKDNVEFIVTGDAVYERGLLKFKNNFKSATVTAKIGECYSLVLFLKPSLKITLQYKYSLLKYKLIFCIGKSKMRFLYCFDLLKEYGIRGFCNKVIYKLGWRCKHE